MELNMCKLIATPILAEQSVEQQSNTLKTDSIKDELKDVSSGGKSIRPLEKKQDEKIRTDHTEKSITELLGSVTTQNCPGTRTSARVIQKMKQDQTRPLTPPPSEHGKKDEKSALKTPSQVRPHRTIWTNLERNYFFDALNEFGKDFEQLSNCINAKLKRRGTSDFPFKTKEQVRLHYYQTYHKICKYIRYSDEIKKPAQELYTLINYGEMRRKLQFLSEKHFMKLRQLIYQGHATIRFKGKNIRIKTPSCKALRRLNQLDDTLEDIRLPTKIEVIVTPANMEAFGRVQALAQNPRARATVPLHKKLSNFIKTFQYKWRSHSARLAEEELKMFPALPNEVTAMAAPTESFAACNPDGEICFRPKPGVAIHRPLLSITEYLSSVNICLTAYEERMGVKVRSETISYDRNIGALANNKRQRTESGSEKRSPEVKKIKTMNSPAHDKSLDEQILKEELAATVSESDTVGALIQAKVDSSSGDELSDELQELLGDSTCESSIIEPNKTEPNATDPSTLLNSVNMPNTGIPQTQARNKRNTSAVGGSSGGTATNTKSTMRTSLNFKPLLNDDSIKSIRKGWTFSQATDITVGDLYVVLGQDSKLELEYYWRDDVPAMKANPTTQNLVTTTSEAQLTTNQVPLPAQQEQLDLATITSGNFLHKELQLADNVNESETVMRLKSLKTSLISNKLKHLLLIANLSDRVRKRQCLCGHTCDRNAAKARIERDLAKSYISSTISNSSDPLTTTNEGLFRQPMAPVRRPILSIDPVRQPLTRQKMSRHVLVQRRLLPPGRTTHGNPMGMYNLQNMYIDSTKANEEQIRSELENQNDAKPSNETNVHEAEINDGNSLPSNKDYAQTTWNSKSSISPTHSTSDYGSAISATSSSNNSNSGNDNKSNFMASWNNSNTSSSDNSITTTTSTSISRTKNGNKVIGCSMPCLDYVEEALLTSTMPESAYDESTTSNFFNGMMSPMHLLRESSSNSRWLEENLNDFSLTSLLGHLDEINATRDILDPSSNMSVISESSVDYRHKFQEITALMQSQEKD